MGREEIITFYKQRIEPFVAIFILAFLITACYLVYQDNQFKKEISINCGFEKDGYECFCEKKDVEFKRSQMLPNFPLVDNNSFPD